MKSIHSGTQAAMEQKMSGAFKVLRSTLHGGATVQGKTYILERKLRWGRNKRGVQSLKVESP